MIFDKSKIPHKPGVYIYKNKSWKIIYVGKAIDLYSRVSSYFSKSFHDSKTVKLVSEISSVETIIVNSELEALILEANLIKKYLPLYNIKLTDDKDYLYIKITKEDFPNVMVARKADLSNAKIYFGPFPSSSTVRSTLKKLRKIFPWCSNPKGKKACFYYHLKLCPGPCAGKIEKQEYNKIINRLSKFLDGKKEQVISDLQKEMDKLSKNLEYEKALNIKKTIEGINYLTEANNIQGYLENPNFAEDQNRLALISLKKDLNLAKLPERIECFDISNISGKFATGAMVVLTEGDIDKSQYRKFKIRLKVKPNDVGMLKEMVERRFKHSEWSLPDLILVDGGIAQTRAVNFQISNSKFQIPVFGLAKRMEWLYSPEGKIIKLSRSSKSLRLLQKIRDEAHRFAITYHRKLRSII